ncbi:MAG: hypothetical protein IJV01_04475 [Bacteroidales bacterium]|nr:hypothetical protein [Bacteroidales bacterium]
MYRCRFFAVVLAALLLLPACRKKDRFEEKEGDRLQLQLLSELPGPRVGLNAARSAYEWETGDVVAVFNDVDDDCEPVDFADGSGSVSVPSGTATVYALYPWSSAQENGPSRAVVQIPVSQTQSVAGTIGRGRYPMIAAAAVADHSATLCFQPVCLSLALNIYKTSGWRADEYLQSVSVTPLQNSAFAGSAELDLGASPLPSFTTGDSGATSVSVSLGTPVLLGDGAPAVPLTFEGQLYLLLARQGYKQLRFEIRTNQALYQLESSADFLFDGTNFDFLLTGIDLAKGTIVLTPGASADSFSENVDVTVTVNDFADLTTRILPDTLSVDIIPDFSRVGYKYGDEPIPTLAVRRTISVSDITAAIAAGTVADTTEFIQNALDEVGASGGGAVLLRNGTYNTSRSLFIGYDNLVLRGESEDGTIIKAIDHNSRRIVIIGHNMLVSESPITSASYVDWAGRKISVSSEALGSATDKTVGSVTRWDYSPVAGSQTMTGSVRITESKVPSGRMYVEVANPDEFSVGERVMVVRPATLNWIHDIWMDRIASNGRDDSNGGGTMQWDERPSTFYKYFDRVIVAISGKRLYFDCPLVFELSSEYGGGYVQHLSSTRITGSGVEYLSFDCDYDPSIVYDNSITSTSSYWGQPYDEMHAWTAVEGVSADHCWIRHITARHMAFGTVRLGQRTKNFSVLDCTSLDPVSVILGGRRYAFQLGGTAQMHFFDNCYTKYDRHSFVASSVSGGPNVYHNCRAENCFSTIGPHLNFIPGILYDRVTSTGNMEAQDAGNGGRGHGWRGVNIVYWNCEASGVSINSPQVSGYNYCVGLIGRKIISKKYTSDYWGGYQDDPYEQYMESLLGTLPTWGSYKISRPEGRWYPEMAYGESGTEHVSLPFNPGLDWWPRFTTSSFSDPLSLYQCQLEDRHARGVYLNSL